MFTIIVQFDSKILCKPNELNVISLNKRGVFQGDTQTSIA